MNKNHQRFSVMRLAIVFSLVALPALVFAANTLTIQPTAIPANDTGKVYITMQNDIPINGMNFIIQFNPLFITPISVQAVGRSASLSGSAGNPYGSNMISFLIYDQQANSILPGSDQIFEITVVAKEFSTSTYMTFFQGLAVDTGMVVTPFDYVTGKITITDVKGNHPHSNLPTVYSLSQNFPNPFNPTSTIRFGLPFVSTATLKIYNIIGQEVRLLVDHKLYEPGEYDEIFDASTLSSGVYFYRLDAVSTSDATKRFTEVKKMVLMK